MCIYGLIHMHINTFTIDIYNSPQTRATFVSKKKTQKKVTVTEIGDESSKFISSFLIVFKLHNK